MAKTPSKELLTFIRKSPSAFHVIANFRAMLLERGYTELRETGRWTIQPGGKYFATRNGSSLIAFRVPQKPEGGFMLAAAHSDSPTFKLKQNPEKLSAGHYVQLSTEKYGGMIMSSWLDRPLSVAGRLLVREKDGLAVKLVDVDRDLLIIPSVAIHMDRTVNDGKKFLANVDTLPLYGGTEAQGGFMKLVAETAGVAEADILGHDLFLYCRQEGVVLGTAEEYLASPKLDDVECAFGCMKGFLQAKESKAVPVCCIFDNEEVGSSTKQGAGSNLLRDVLRRIASALGRDEEGYLAMLAESFMVSADNAHAQHPNHPEYADGGNAPWINEGVVIKFNANQKYTTDAVSCGIFRSVCEEAGVPVQVYANRADLPGGSTLGSIANTKVAVNTVDIGLAQLAMHSSFETAGALDLDYLTKAMTVYFGKTLRATESGYRL
ncbi:MAG: M18 family aminopeptidase [Clostridia bacterium]|nr:M18 family aminopeptidase [Clostridia bacterium]